VKRQQSDKVRIYPKGRAAPKKVDWHGEQTKSTKRRCKKIGNLELLACSKLAVIVVNWPNNWAITPPSIGRTRDNGM